MYRAVLLGVTAGVGLVRCLAWLFRYSLLTLAFVLATRGEAQGPTAARSRCGRHRVRDPFPSFAYPPIPSSQGLSRGLTSLVFAVLLLALPFPFCNDGHAATVKLANLRKHSVYFRLDDQPTFIGAIDHSLLVPPFGAPGPAPNSARDRDQRSNRQEQCP